VTSCAVCTVYVETRSTSFLVEPQNQGRRFVTGLTSKPVCQWYGLKTTGTVFSGLASQLVALVFSSLTLKSVATISPGLTSKAVVCFLVEPQNQGGGGFSTLDLKIDSYGLMIWASNLLRRFLGLALKTKQDRVC
jgi:hypothetical protein